MRKKIHRLLYSLSLMSALITGSSVHAKIPTKAFKNITTRYFKKGKELNSPVIGEALLEAGTIFDVRFMGNFRTARNDNQERAYLQDASDDPFWNLNKHLFPSPAGGLAVDTTGEYNFGGLVKDPATVSLLLNFCNDLRKGKADLKAYSERLFESFQVDKKKKKNAMKQAVLPLLYFIEESIRVEQGGKSAYPAGMTEGLITAFFCEKFENVQHIRQLLVALNDDIVDRAAVNAFQENDFLTDGYAETLTGKQHLDLDDVYALTNAGLFTAITPYKSGTHLKSNGSTYEYDRKTGQFLTHKKPFADCAEMAMRHLLNLLLFNAETREFDLTHIKAYVTQHAPDNPYFANFLLFYDKQKPDDANNGDIMMRSLFNTIMADLNTEDDPYKLEYVKDGRNEVEPGFINIMMAFKRVFGLQIENPPQLDESMHWLRQSLGVLFNALNPTKDYTIDVHGLKKDKHEISGDLNVTVKEKDSYKDQFSFTYMSSYGRHSEITRLTNLLEEKKDALDQALDSHTKDTTIRDDTAEEALRLLAKEGTIFSQVHHPFFHIFNKALQDFNSMIEKLKVISEKYEEWNAEESPFKSVMPLINSTVIHILESTLEADPETIRRISPILLTLAKQPEFEEILGQFKKISVSFGSDEERETAPFIDFSGLHKMKQLKELNLSNVDMSKTTGIDSPSSIEILRFDQLYETKNQDLFLGKHTQLREIFLSSTGYKSVSGMEALPHLEKLTIESEESFFSEGIKSLSFQNAANLREIKIVETAIEKLEGTDDLRGLETLKLKKLTGLTELSLPNSQKLRDIELVKMPLQKLEKLGALTSLERLKLSELTAMTSLDLSKCDRLVDLSLDKSSISTIVGLEDTTALRHLTLTNMSNINSLPFEKLTQVTELNLTGTLLQSFEGIQLMTELSNLKLRGWRYAMRDVSKLTAYPLPKLKELNLSYTEIENLNGLQAFTSLEKLDVSDIRSLSDSTLTNDKLVELKLSNSQFQKVNLKGCLELSKLKWSEGAQIRSFIMKNNHKLTTLSLPQSEHVDMLELEDLSALTVLSIKFARYMQISLKNLDSLQELDVSGLTVHKVNFAGSFKALKRIKFSDRAKYEVNGLQELIDIKWKAREELEIINPPKGIILRSSTEREEERGV